jgi:Multidrug resistance efflux pump
VTANNRRRLTVVALVVGLVAAVGLGTYIVADGRTTKEGKPAADKRAAGARAVLIDIAEVRPRTLEIYEEVVGSLENAIDPKIGAEVAGRVTRVLGFTGMKVKRGNLLAEIDAQDFEIQSRADAAEVKRLQALLENQERVVARQQKLVAQGFISQNALDEALAQRGSSYAAALAAVLTVAQAPGLDWSKAVSPAEERIDEEWADPPAFPPQAGTGAQSAVIHFVPRKPA